MTSFEALIGQARAVAVLEHMLRTRRVPQALLFSGPQSVGKATAARTFAAAWSCEDRGPTGAACGRCTACTLVAKDAHPDLLTIRLPPKKDHDSADELASVIRVEQIRELSHLVSLTPRRGRGRIFIIDPADRMNAESQNALLKTLEEPPPSALLILVASRPHLLLPTVRSRCFSVAFSAVRVGELAPWLVGRGLSPAEAGTRAALAAGRPGAALDLDLACLLERRAELLAALEALTERPPALSDLPAQAASLAGKDEATLEDSLELLLGLLRDASRIATGGADALLHADLRSRLEPLGERLGARRAAALVESVERVRGYLRFNVNRLLIAESLLAAVGGGPLP